MFKQMEPPMPYLITSWLKKAHNDDPDKRPNSTKLLVILKSYLSKIEAGKHSPRSTKRKATTQDMSTSDTELTSTKTSREETKPPMS
ncbi:hypothetical protein Pmani_036233 [Petrolisthes manimaculis]|uniref:Uncharacterized protein n=1 Tax=Petrolisthes manimaculis TaxID=1843537 RepID=A0AAE1NKL3_9EUCA|nr:hypothetical protein Pmani_036233 [Petrolisthes manimaculis]